MTDRDSDESLDTSGDLARAGAPALGRFSASLAHDLNQPLAAIVANCDTCLHWLRMRPPNIEQVARAVERTRRDAHRVSSKLERATALVRKLEPEQSLVYLGELVPSVASALASELRRHRIQVKMLIPPDLPPIIGTRVELQYVFASLTANAIESLEQMEENARHLSIECVRTRQRDGEMMFVTVRDSGHAIADVERQPVFDALVTTRSAVLAMGLAVARTIVRRHGGELHARNTPEGPQLEFSLPLSP